MNIEEATTLFYRLLKDDAELNATLAGRIYVRKRSEGRETEECIVVNTPYADHNHPQQGYTNINIHVPSIEVVIDGQVQHQPNGKRIGELVDIVMRVLEEAIIPGIGWQSPQETLMEEPSRHEYYDNLRINWINANQ